MDTARYGLEPPPPSRRNDFNAWRSALDNAYAQLEHQHNRRAWPHYNGRAQREHSGF